MKWTIVHANAYFVVMWDEFGKVSVISTNHVVRISERLKSKRLKEAQVISWAPPLFEPESSQLEEGFL